TQGLNLASLRTNGIDFEARYNAPLGSGRVNLAALVSYIDHYTISVPAAQTIEQGGCVAGISAASECDTPHWSATLQAAYSTERGQIFIQERYIGPGKYEATFTEGTDINNNHVSSMLYTDVTLEARIGHDHQFTAFFTINNIFNR